MKSIRYYILDENNQPVGIDDILEWSKQFGGDIRRVARWEQGNTVVSTVFLGIDHNYSDSGDPILFETMIFSDNPDTNEFQDRYCTWDEAVAGHNRTVEAVKNGVNIMGRKTLTLKLDI